MAQGTEVPHPASLRREERILAVLRVVNGRGEAGAGELAAATGVSAATLRRDLADMADQGLLVRTHGGARALAEHDEVPVRLRDALAADAKHRIAQHAAALIPAGPHAVGLSGGTTTAEVAGALAHRERLTVVTNAVTVALQLAARPAPEVLLIGGRVRPASFEAVGPLAERAFAAVRIDTAILGVDGLSAEHGATTHDEEEARTNRAMLARAGRIVVVADGSKIGRATSARMVDAARIDVLVTDVGADRAELARLRRAGVDVHLVDAHLVGAP